MPDTEPKSMEHAIDWFKEYEVPKGVGLERNGSVCLWFHGELATTQIGHVTDVCNDRSH